MRILLIDTCGATGSIALAIDDSGVQRVLHASLPGRTASERLVPAIKDLISHDGITLQSLDSVVVVHGPGSFTGVRVALSAAKGLCQALNLPLVAVSRLAVLAHLSGADPGEHVRSLLDAGRGDIYSGLYLQNTCQLESLLTLDELRLAHKSEPAKLVTCDPVVAQSVAALQPRLVAEPNAEDALPLALVRIKRQSFDDVAEIDANYLRRTDAEIFAKPLASKSTVHQSETPAL